MTFYGQRTVFHDCERGLGDANGDQTTELLIVEGVSASKAVLRFRDASFQAILPMQGKPMNASKASKRAVGANLLYNRLITAIGAGWGNEFQLDRVRFGRIVMLFDPDADGIHCGVLMSLFFHRWMPCLIASGRLAVIRPPLFEIQIEGSSDTRLAYTEGDLHAKIGQLRQSGASSVSHRRFRGLASLPADILQRCCIDPESRIQQQIGPDDIEAMKRIFHVPDA